MLTSPPRRHQTLGFFHSFIPFSEAENVLVLSSLPEDLCNQKTPFLELLLYKSHWEVLSIIPIFVEAGIVCLMDHITTAKFLMKIFTFSCQR